MVKRWGWWLKTSWGGLGGQYDELIFEKCTLVSKSCFFCDFDELCLICDVFLTFLYGFYAFILYL